MEQEETKNTPKQMPDDGREEAPKKHQWQATKESWYDHLNVSVRQLDIIIGLAVGGLILVSIIIALDAAGVF